MGPMGEAHGAHWAPISHFFYCLDVNWGPWDPMVPQKKKMTSSKSGVSGKIGKIYYLRMWGCFSILRSDFSIFSIFC